MDDQQPVRQISQDEADELYKRVMSAPELSFPTITDPGQQGAIVHVDKVGFLPSMGAGYVVTTQGEWRRLPEALALWARDVTSMALTTRNPFPCQVEFGQLDGRAYAEIL